VYGKIIKMNNVEQIKKIKQSTDQIQGWLTDLEGELLFDCAKNCQGKGVIVELGSWKGKSTIWLAKGSQEGKMRPIYAIDPHQGSVEYDLGKGVNTLAEFKSNIDKAGVSSLVKSIVETSVKAAENFTEPVELIFIDASHLYEDVKKDFEVWFPKVVDGGVMVFHDSSLSPGVIRLVKESVFLSNQFKNVGFTHSATHAQKVTQNSLSDRIRNRYILFLKNIYSFFAKYPIPAPIKRGLGNFARLFVK